MEVNTEKMIMLRWLIDVLPIDLTDDWKLFVFNNRIHRDQEV